MTLDTYKKKRSFDTSKEPPGKISKKHKTLSFVVQKHAASHLHYDLRLEVNGVLKSWAVPKGPSLNPADKRLAIMVEDHPYDYRSFEGIIPKGNYGAGTVMVWDTGTYYPLDKNAQVIDEKTFETALSKGSIHFFLEGKKLHGHFVLVKSGKNPNDNKWLLIKGKDEYSSTKDITQKSESALSDRTMEQIGDEIDLHSVSKTKMLRKVKPTLAFASDKPFDSKEWLFEIKWDGYRAIAEVEDQHVKLYSRNSLSFNQRFPVIIKALQQLHVEAVFDGEIVVLDKQGKSNFQALQNYQKTGKGNLCYYIFDLLYYGGHDLRSLPLLQRKQLLKSLLSSSKELTIRFSEHVLTRGKDFFAAIEKQRLEGMMAKEINSPYTSRRSRSWLKIKTHNRQEAIICGFTAPKGSRKEIGALLLGVYENGKLRYIGRAGGGFSDKSLVETKALLTPLIIDKSPFANPPGTRSTVKWLKPTLVCEVSFAEWTEEGIMRQPIFLGIREDKDPKEVKREGVIEKPTTSLIMKKRPKDITLTNLDKIFWPKEGYTKGDLIHYYQEMAPYVLPYLKNRPQSLRRYPNGIEEDGFFQKNIDSSFPEWVPSIEIKHEEKSIKYMMIQDLKSLLFAANLGCIDFNPFNSRISHLNQPDYMVLDLDPVNVSFEKVVETALVIHDILDSMDIPNYCKTSGSRGMHIYVPLHARYTYEQAKHFAQLIAELCYKRLPRLTSLERRPSQRQKKVYIDCLQNNFGQTLAAPYSIRPKPGATASTPLEWVEVISGLDPKAFTIHTLPQRVKEKGDLFLPVLGKGIDIGKILKSIRK